MKLTSYSVYALYEPKTLIKLKTTLLQYRCNEVEALNKEINLLCMKTSMSDNGQKC